MILCPKTAVHPSTAGRGRSAVYRCGGFRADIIRPYQIPGKPCRGGYHPPAVSRRSLGVAELHAGTFGSALVQCLLDAEAFSNEQSSCSDLKKQAPLIKIKNFFFHRARRILFPKKNGGRIPEAKVHLL